MSANYSTRSHSPLKTVLGKIRDWYQAYCMTYKTHTMATHHGGTGCPVKKSLDILTEDPEHASINDSTHSSDATVDLGDQEAVGHPEDPAYDSQDRLTALMREIKDLHQWVAAGEGQPAETLDCILQKSLDSNPSATSICTCRTSVRSNMAVHRYFVHHTETIQPHKLLTVG